MPLYWQPLLRTGPPSHVEAATVGDLEQYLPLEGGEMRGPIDMGEQDIFNLGDLISANWDGAGHGSLDLSSSSDSTATSGWAWDSSAGTGQVMETLYIGGTLVMLGGADFQIPSVSGTRPIGFTANQGASLEIGRTDGTVATPFIDFHTGDDVDWNVRLLATGGLSGLAGGTLDVDAAAFTFNTNTILHAGNHGTTGDPHTQYLLLGGGTMTGDVEYDGNHIEMGALGGGGEIRLRSGFAVAASGGVGLKALDHSGANADGLGLYGEDGASIWVGQTKLLEVLASDINLSTDLDLNGNDIEMGVLNSGGELRFRSGFAVAASGGSGLKALDHSGSNADGLGIYGQDGVSIWVGQVKQLEVKSSSLTMNGNTVWHAGNDSSLTHDSEHTTSFHASMAHTGHYGGTTATAANAVHGSSTLRLLSTSTRDIKTNITYLGAPDPESDDPILRQKVARFKEKGFPNGRPGQKSPWFYGLLAEDVAEDFPEAYYETEVPVLRRGKETGETMVVKDYDLKVEVARLIVTVQQQDRRITTLEAA